MENLTITAFREGLRGKKFSATEVARACFDRIRKKDPEIRAFLRLHEESALAAAGEVDASVSAGREVGPLAGVPIALKDNMLVEGEIATAGSRILENYRASYDSGVVKKLKRAHAVILGKTNLDEFAMGSSTENSAFQVTRNPHDLSRVPGGSSGGSAAAVAADLALAALGSDTGGSIRQPAALSGVVGLKPTYGAVSRSGLIAMASSLDQIGPFARTVADARIVFDAIRGHDPMDATSSPDHDGPSVRLSTEELRGLTVGIPQEYFVAGLDPQVAEAVESVIDELKAAGIKFKSVSLPHTSHALSVYYIVMPAEVSANLARFDGIRYARPELAYRNLADIYYKTRGRGLGPEVKRRVILGAFVLSSGYYDAYYAKAQKVRALLTRDFERAFEDVDILLTPTTPTPAFKIGEKTADPLTMYLEDVFTVPLNLAGLPGISIPCRVGPGALPVGFQLVGRPFREGDILSLGEFYESRVS